MQPRQLDALFKQHQRREASTEFLFAQLTAATINFSDRGPKEPVKPSELMPSELAKKSVAVARPCTAADVQRVMAGFIRGN